MFAMSHRYLPRFSFYSIILLSPLIVVMILMQCSLIIGDSDLPLSSIRSGYGPLAPKQSDVEILDDKSKFVIPDYPILYVIFGELPLFLRTNIELASRRSPVTVISDAVFPRYFKFRNNNPNGDPNVVGEQSVIVLPMSDYSEGRNRFVRLYKHLSRDKNNYLAESRCFQRWFVVHDYMLQHNITHVLFGDGDSAIFTSARSAWDMRSKCSAVINIDTQRSQYYWVGAGEASLWTLPAISDFCKFIESTYSKHLDIISLKFKTTQTNVVDMSLLWLWWVAHHDAPGWDSGRPYYTASSNAFESRSDEEMRKVSDDSFNETKKLRLPDVDRRLHICNGMDVVNRTVFDHLMGWYTIGKRFNLDLDGDGVPFAYGAVGRLGGKPESLIREEIEKLENQKLFINNIHYQGSTKEFIFYDICRVLSITGHRIIYDPAVRNQCQSEHMRRGRRWDCLPHPRYDKSTIKSVCI